MFLKNYNHAGELFIRRIQVVHDSWIRLKLFGISVVIAFSGDTDIAFLGDTVVSEVHGKSLSNITEIIYNGTT